MKDTTKLESKVFSSPDNIKNMVNMEAKSKWQCPKCGVGLAYNPTYKLEDYAPLAEHKKIATDF
jgi:ribosomal protein L37AE/L43A